MSADGPLGEFPEASFKGPQLSDLATGLHLDRLVEKLGDVR